MKKSNRDVVLLLTACVSPNSDDSGPVGLDGVRRAEYVKAVRWYIENTPYKVVLCENSGTDLSDDLAKVRRGGYEVLTFTAEKMPPNRSKGYGELGIIEYALAQSETLRACKSDDIIVKITGRLILLNIVDIVERLKKRAKTGPFVSAYVNGHKGGSDCRFIFATSDFFKRLTALKEHLWHGFNFERATSHVAFTMMREGSTRLVFPSLPARVSGHSGSRMTVYDITDRQYFRLRLRHAVRKLLFDVGILPLEATMDAMMTIPVMPDELR